MLMSPFHALVTTRELAAISGITAAYASSDIEVFPYQVAAADVNKSQLKNISSKPL